MSSTTSTPLAAGQALHLLGEILRAVVDRRIGAEVAAGRAPSSALPAVAKTVAPKALASWIAVTPMPEVPPWISTVSPARQPAMAEQIGPDGEVGLRQGGGAQRVVAGGPGQRLRLGRRAVFGIGAAIGQRADLVADLAARDLGAHRDHLAGAFQADASGSRRAAADRCRCAAPRRGGSRRRPCTRISTSSGFGAGSGPRAGTSTSGPPPAPCAMKVISCGSATMPCIPPCVARGPRAARGASSHAARRCATALRRAHVSSAPLARGGGMEDRASARRRPRADRPARRWALRSAPALARAAPWPRRRRSCGSARSSRSPARSRCWAMRASAASNSRSRNATPPAACSAARCAWCAAMRPTRRTARRRDAAPGQRQRARRRDLRQPMPPPLAFAGDARSPRPQGVPVFRARRAQRPAITERGFRWVFRASPARRRLRARPRSTA